MPNTGTVLVRRLRAALQTKGDSAFGRQLKDTGRILAFEGSIPGGLLRTFVSRVVVGHALSPRQHAMVLRDTTINQTITQARTPPKTPPPTLPLTPLHRLGRGPVPACRGAPPPRRDHARRLPERDAGGRRGGARRRHAEPDGDRGPHRPGRLDGAPQARPAARQWESCGEGRWGQQATGWQRGGAGSITLWLV